MVGEHRDADRKPLAFARVDPDTDEASVARIFARMKARGVGPLNIHRMIAHAPVVYEGFSHFASALREPGATSRADRELAILLVLRRKSATYETIQHERIGRAVGLSDAQLAALNHWRQSTAFSPRERLILELAEGVASAAGFDQETSDALLAMFSPQELVELAMTSCFYVSVAHFTHTILVEAETTTTSYGE